MKKAPNNSDSVSSLAAMFMDPVEQSRAAVEDELPSPMSGIELALRWLATQHGVSPSEVAKEINGNGALARLIRKVFEVDERETQPYFAAARMLRRVRRAGFRGEAAYREAADQLSRLGKAVTPATIKRYAQRQNKVSRRE